MNLRDSLREAVAHDEALEQVLELGRQGTRVSLDESIAQVPEQWVLLPGRLCPVSGEPEGCIHGLDKQGSLALDFSIILQAEELVIGILNLTYVFETSVHEG